MYSWTMSSVIVASLVMWSAIIITGRMIAYSALVPQWWLDFTAN